MLCCLSPNAMLVFGFSDLEHDTAAALLGNDGFVAAIEEEKLSRSPGSGGIPHLALERCLHESGANSAEVSMAGIASRPKRAWLRDEGKRLTAFVCPTTNASRRRSQDSLYWKLEQLTALRRSLGPPSPLINFEHHLCHAASAFYPSPFDRALVLTLDQCGDMWSGLLALGEAGSLSILHPLRFPNSLGWFYSRVTELLGFRPGRDEHKVQWLSKEGTPEHVSVFRRLFSKDSEGLPALDLRHFVSAPATAGHSVFSAQIVRDLQISD